MRTENSLTTCWNTDRRIHLFDGCVLRVINNAVIMALFSLNRVLKLINRQRFLSGSVGGKVSRQYSFYVLLQTWVTGDCARRPPGAQIYPG